MSTQRKVRKTTTSQSINTGSITLPAEVGEEKMVVEVARKWGADAIRDSDGTELSPEMLDLGLEVYSTICLVRAEQTYPRRHMDHLPQKFLMSDPVSATSSRLVIDPMSGFYREKYVIDTKHDARRYWEVIDRTTGQRVKPSQWTLNPRTGKVTIRGAVPFHVYTVNFLVFQIWDTVSMYNHLTNKWTRPHVISVDPYHKPCWDHLMAYYEKYLEEHPRTDVVRLTSLAYAFAIDSDQDAVDKFRDWTGYQDTISVPALEDFAKEYGYRLRAEDFVDQGYYNAACRVPSKGYLDWMEFIHRFVVKFGKALADRTHRAGKRAAIFWGDHWAGVEPHQPGFLKMGLDIHVGAAEDGVALRRVSDAPGNLVRELRLYPYFFPDVFRAGGDPLSESLSNWIKIRRALMRKPVDRLGYGGYLSLALKFPKFVDHVAELCQEFRTFKANSRRRGIAEGAHQSRRAQLLGQMEGLDQQLRRPAEVPRQAAGCHPGRRHEPPRMPLRPAGRGPVPQLLGSRKERHPQGRGRHHQRWRCRNRLERRALVGQPESRGRNPPVHSLRRRVYRVPRPERFPAPGPVFPARRCPRRGQGSRPHAAVRASQGQSRAQAFHHRRPHGAR